MLFVYTSFYYYEFLSVSILLFFVGFGNNKMNMSIQREIIIGKDNIAGSYKNEFFINTYIKLAHIIPLIIAILFRDPVIPDIYCGDI